jgi:hypothetical protein
MSLISWLSGKLADPENILSLDIDPLPSFEIYLSSEEKLRLETAPYTRQPQLIEISTAAQRPFKANSTDPALAGYIFSLPQNVGIPQSKDRRATPAQHGSLHTST